MRPARATTTGSATATGNAWVWWLAEETSCSGQDRKKMIGGWSASCTKLSTMAAQRPGRPSCRWSPSHAPPYKWHNSDQQITGFATSQISLLSASAMLIAFTSNSVLTDHHRVICMPVWAHLHYHILHLLSLPLFILAWPILFHTSPLSNWSSKMPS